MLLSEWHENNSDVIFEAYAFGKPVIGSRICGVPKLVNGGITGLTLEPGNC